MKPSTLCTLYWLFTIELHAEKAGNRVEKGTVQTNDVSIMF